jgi:hypothetical protein
MFQFPRFAFVPYGFEEQIPSFDICNSKPWRKPELGIADIEGGLPHSEIHGSKLVRSSP